MKKILLAAIAVMTFAFANAQETRFGIKAGANLANFTGDLEGTSGKVGFLAGGFVEIKVADKFFIQPELLFSYQGAKREESDFDYHAEGKVNLSYLSIPVLAKYYILDKFSIEAGPQVGFLLGAKQKFSSTDMGVEFSANQDVKDDYKSVDFGFNLGAGYDFTENVSVGLRYTFGLSNIADAGDGDTDFSINNSVFALAVGYKF